jgi:DNA modification methylase
MAVDEQVITDNYAIYNGDCIEVMKSLPDDKIHLSVYSPPFGGLYHYSSDERDMSNSADYAEFFEHYRHCVEEIHRVTMPGRISAVHCCDISSGNTGRDFLTDFPGDIIRLHAEVGFDFICRHVIWKEPLWVRNRLMIKSLTHQGIIEDAAYAGVATADQVLVFRKRGRNPLPIQIPHGLPHYSGGEPVPNDILPYRNWQGDQIENRFSQWVWRHYASSVWDDIRMGRVLPFQDSNDPEDEKHVHPLQLDVIDRVVYLRSMPGETVLTPFLGVGSEAYAAVSAGRKAIGIELKKSYFRQAVKNMMSAGSEVTSEQTSLAL